MAQIKTQVKCLFTEMPSELLVRIMQLCEPTALVLLVGTCRKLRNVALNYRQTIMTSIINRYYPEFLQVLAQACLPHHQDKFVIPSDFTEASIKEILENAYLNKAKDVQVGPWGPHSESVVVADILMGLSSEKGAEDYNNRCLRSIRDSPWGYLGLAKEVRSVLDAQISYLVRHKDIYRVGEDQFQNTMWECDCCIISTSTAKYSRQTALCAILSAWYRQWRRPAYFPSPFQWAVIRPALPEPSDLGSLRAQPKTMPSESAHISKSLVWQTRDFKFDLIPKP